MQTMTTSHSKLIWTEPPVSPLGSITQSIDNSETLVLNMPTSKLALNIASVPQRHDNNNPLWQGPCGKGPLGGITQSMIVRFLSCRERFRLRYILGLDLYGKWNHRIGYGNMWHICEQFHAGQEEYETPLLCHTQELIRKYRTQEADIVKWYNVCLVQFPEYAKYWKEHPDVKNRTPLMRESVFDVGYILPSGRMVRLRGKFDSVDLITDKVTGPDGGIYLQENKTKGDIDKLQVERQLKFDLQTMLYLIALERVACIDYGSEAPILGVRYNVIRRPLSGGVGNIRPHKGKATRSTITQAETDEEFYERLRHDYIADDPAYWFFRVRSEVSKKDIQVFKDTCFDPLLETICWWYEQVTNARTRRIDDAPPPMNYRTPFGVYSSLEEGGATEYDAYLETGSEAGLQRVETMFPELQ